MADPELDTLIASNIGDLDTAARYLKETLQPAIASKIDEIWRKFRIDNDWLGEEEFDETEPWLAPKEWRKPAAVDGDDTECWFNLGYASGAGELEYEYWLASLVGAGPGSFGMRWTRDRPTRAWRKSMSLVPEMVTKLRSEGFIYEEREGTFFLPISIDQAELVSALQYEAPEQALEPIEQALQKLLSSRPNFDALLARTKQTA